MLASDKDNLGGNIASTQSEGKLESVLDDLLQRNINTNTEDEVPGKTVVETKLDSTLEAIQEVIQDATSSMSVTSQEGRQEDASSFPMFGMVVGASEWSVSGSGWSVRGRYVQSAVVKE